MTDQKTAALDNIIKLAIMAVGGQGGGVLTNWIIDLAEANGYAVQATSVAGVAQRTGATIYYIEMLPASDRQPVFSLMPAESDVDILIAAEWMEAGRGMMRRFVSPDRTVLIASSHRTLAGIEKAVPGNGIADNDDVRQAAEKSARKVIAFDMESIAANAGTMISASLFGALAGAAALPFSADAFRDTVRRSGRGVTASLTAFDAAFERAAKGGDAIPAATPPPAPPPLKAQGPERLLGEWRALTARLADIPNAARPLAEAGLGKVVDYQDTAYGAAWLDRIEALVTLDRKHGGAGQVFAFSAQAAKYLANAWCYDDIIRVADLKTRAARTGRIDREVGASDSHIVQVTEYVHPGAAEFISMMPHRLGRFIVARPALVRRIDMWVNRGRRIRSDSLRGFFAFYLLAGLRRWRRGLYRHSTEMEHIESWLAAAIERLPHDYQHAVSILKARRLIKGYSDTHARGLGKFDRVMQGATLLVDHPDAGEWTERLIRTALADVEGEGLDGALKTVESFASPQAAPLAEAQTESQIDPQADPTAAG